MRRTLRVVGWGLVLLLGTVVLLYAVARLRGPTAQQQSSAITLQRVTPQGRNAFTALWLLGYDVPDAQREAVLQDDRRAFEQANPLERITLQSVAQARYPKWTIDEADRALDCHEATDCLARMATNPAPYRALVTRHAALIARVRGLEHYDFSRSPWPPGEKLMDYRPLYQGVRLALVEDRLTFSAGDHARALGNVCTMTAGMRRLMRAPEVLIDSMILREVGRELAQAYVQMLAALPADEPLPAHCAQAFAPATAQEVSVCEPMRGEFAFISQSLPRQSAYLRQSQGRSWDDVLNAVLYDQDNTTAQLARKHARACSPEVARQIAQDQPVRDAPGTQSLWRLECLGNYLGCWLVRINPGFDDYQQRMQDFGAQLRLVGALVWLREHPEAALAMPERLAQLPAALRSQPRPIEAAEGGKALRVRMYDQREGQPSYWIVPLGG